MESEFSIHHRNELRSNKVKHIGKVPVSLVRCGIIIIVVITIALIAAICLLPYPYSAGESIVYHFLEMM
jgi:hypothetical protein